MSGISGTRGTCGINDLDIYTGRALHGRMRPMQDDRPQSTTVEIRLRYETEEGPLHVRAQRVGDRWRVDARCGCWRQVGVGTELADAAASALGPYAAGTLLAVPPRGRGKARQ